MPVKSKGKKTFANAGHIGGQIGGRSTSEPKQAAARENGKLGGRPLKPDADPKRRARYLRKKILKQN